MNIRSAITAVFLSIVALGSMTAANADIKLIKFVGTWANKCQSNQSKDTSWKKNCLTAQARLIS